MAVSTAYVNQLLPKDAARVSIPGHIIQVVSYSTTSSPSTTTTSGYGVTTGVVGTITPTNANNKILVTLYTGVASRPAVASESMSLSLQRNGIEINRATNFMYNSGSYPQEMRASVTFSHLDSPATTGLVTYELFFRSRLGNSVSFNANQDIATITLMEIAQ